MPPLLKTPVSLVTVCVVESLFVHVTTVPTETVRVAGEKAKFAMETLAAEGATLVALVVTWFVVTGLVDVVELLAPPHAASVSIHNTANMQTIPVILILIRLPVTHSRSRVLPEGLNNHKILLTNVKESSHPPYIAADFLRNLQNVTLI